MQPVQKRTRLHITSRNENRSEYPETASNAAGASTSGVSQPSSLAPASVSQSQSVTRREQLDANPQDTMETQEQFLEVPSSPSDQANPPESVDAMDAEEPPVFTHPALFQPLYPDPANGETVGNFLIRLLWTSIYNNHSRELMRSDVEYYATHFNRNARSTEFPTSLYKAWQLLGYTEGEGLTRYEVCSFKLKSGEFCPGRFPPLTKEQKKEHISIGHTCDLCTCQEQRNGRLCGTHRFTASEPGEGRIKPKAGGIYLGLGAGFKALQQHSQFLAENKLFLDGLESPDYSGPRGMRWHSSPNGKAMRDKFCSTVTERRELTFYATFWDYVELAGTSTTYSVGMKLVHVIDLRMMHVGKAQYVFLVHVTFGPRKMGHYDAHHVDFFEEMKYLQDSGLDGNRGNRFILAKTYADRPAMEGELGLCGHNSNSSCGFCTGGSATMAGATRYFGYVHESARTLVEQESAVMPLPVDILTVAQWMEAGRAADRGDRRVLKRAAKIIHDFPHLDPLVNGVFAVSHCLGHGVCGNFIDIFLCTKKKGPAFLKLPKPVMAKLKYILKHLVVPDDASKAYLVATTHRGWMTFSEEVECLAFILPLVLPLAFEACPDNEREEHAWILVALENLVLAVQWYTYGIVPAVHPGTKESLVTFEEKARFGNWAILRYAQIIEACRVIKCLTYNLHAMVYHFLHQELQGGSLCCDNEMFGERFFKYVTKFGEGLVQTPCVELTIANKVQMTRALTNVECVFHARTPLLKSHTGLMDASRDEKPILFNSILTFSHAEMPGLSTCIQTLSSNIDGEIALWASSFVNGFKVHGVFYGREVARSSFWVSYILPQSGLKAYGCVQYFVSKGTHLYVALHELELVAVDKYSAIELSVPDPPTLGLVPLEQIRFKLVVYNRGPGHLRAAECLHIRVEG